MKKPLARSLQGAFNMLETRFKDRFIGCSDGWN